MADTEGRRSPLADVLPPPTPEAREGGVVIEPLHCALVQVIARRGVGSGFLAGANRLLGGAAPSESGRSLIRGGLTIAATAPGEYWCLGAREDPEAFLAMVRESFADSGTAFQQSDARAVMRLSGVHAGAVLAKGCPIDFHAGAFAAPGASLTTIEAMPALVIKRDESPAFDIAVARSYTESFTAWLLEAGAAFGIRVASG